MRLLILWHARKTCGAGTELSQPRCFWHARRPGYLYLRLPPASLSNPTSRLFIPLPPPPSPPAPPPKRLSLARALSHRLPLRGQRTQRGAEQGVAFSRPRSECSSAQYPSADCSSLPLPKASCLCQSRRREQRGSERTRGRQSLLLPLSLFSRSLSLPHAVTFFPLSLSLSTGPLDGVTGRRQGRRGGERKGGWPVVRHAPVTCKLTPSPSFPFPLSPSPPLTASLHVGISLTAYLR